MEHTPLTKQLLVKNPLKEKTYRVISLVHSVEITEIYSDTFFAKKFVKSMILLDKELF